MRRLLYAAVVLIVIFLLGIGPAQAHTALKSSDPAENAKVKDLRKVTLVFTQSVRLPVVIVRGEDGSRYESGDPEIDGTKVITDVVPSVPPGQYTVAWRVVSPDGHPIQGEIPFTVVGTPPAGAPTTSASPSPTASPTPSTTLADTATPSAAADGTPVGSSSAAAVREEEQSAIPAWVWIAVFGVAGIGIGMMLSLRKKS